MAPKRASREKPDPFAGMSPDAQNAFQAVLSKMNTNNYNGDPLSLMHQLSAQDPSDVDALLAAVAGMKTSDDELTTFDYAKAPVRKNSFWVVQLTPMGFQGKDEKDYREEYFPGSTPEMAPPGMPPSDWVLKCIKRAIASPLPPNRPSLPGLLLIAYKLGPHIGALSPFLDSLPAPFTWRLETPEESEDVASGVHDLNVKGIMKATKRSEEEKTLGNEAVARKDRGAAVKHYSEAYEFLADAIAQKPTDAEARDIKRRMAICLGNRAAAWLLEGEGRDAEKALQDAERATAFDENYGKAYYRQAKAHQLLGASDNAINVLTSALKRSSLISDKGLNDVLVDAYGGFPDSPEELRAFCHRLFIDKDGDQRARGLKEFARRANTHVKKVLGPGASITKV